MPLLSARQLAEWQAFAGEEGLPDYRNDIHWGMVSSLIVNSNPYRKGEAVDPRDLMPYYDRLSEAISQDEFTARTKAMLRIAKGG